MFRTRSRPFPTRRAATLGTLAALPFVSACATAPRVPSRLTPAPLTLEEAFVGRTVGQGVFRVPLARVTRRFRADLVGTMDGSRLSVVEDFFFEDGETDRLTWVFDRVSPGRWTGRRDDTVGVAEVREEGGVIRLVYLADVRSRGTVNRLHFSDVIYRQDAGLVINDAVVSRFGLAIGSVRFELRRA